MVKVFGDRPSGVSQNPSGRYHSRPGPRLFIPMTDKEVVDIAGIAEFLDISKRSVRRLIKYAPPKRIPYNRIGGSLRFHKPTVTQWLKDTTIRSEDDELKPYILPGRKRLTLHD